MLDYQSSGQKSNNYILIATKEPIDLMANIPVEVEEIEDAMREAMMSK